MNNKKAWNKTFVVAIEHGRKHKNEQKKSLGASEEAQTKSPQTIPD
jgi:hypothetical protein